MEIFPFLLELGKAHGLTGLIVGLFAAFLIWDRVLVPRKRKKNGEWVSWQSLHESIKNMEKIHKEHEGLDNERFMKLHEMEVNVEKMLSSIQDKLHSYTETIRSDLEKFRTELNETMRDEAKIVREEVREANARMDKLWELLGKK